MRCQVLKINVQLDFNTSFFSDWVNQNVLNYYGFMNRGTYEHFLSRCNYDVDSVKSEDFDENVGEQPFANIKPRKTKFTPQSFHSCCFCGKWYRSKTSLGLHKRLECGKEPAFQCPYCPLRTHQKGNLQVHIKKKHTIDDDQCLKNKNPILAHELGLAPSLNPQQLGINRELSSELTITRTQPTHTLLNKTPNLSHILSQPNKAQRITQFPLSAAEITAAAALGQSSCRVRSKGLASLPPGISVTQRRISQEANFSELTITPRIIASPDSPQESAVTNDLKKLPELTRILNSQDPIPPNLVILDSFSIASSSTALDTKDEILEKSAENEI